MSSEKSLTPQIRFKGFTEAWEQRKLEDLFAYGGSGGTPSSNNRNYYNGNIPFLNISDLKERNIRFTEKQITTLGLHNSAAWIVPAGSISLAMYASVGKVGIICNDTATSQAFYNMVVQDIHIRNFLYTRLEKADTCNEWEPYISTGTQRNLNAEKVRNFKINIPSKQEMNQIGSIFEILDSLITLHQRKLDALKKIKSALLEKMFPKDGSNIPEIRFTGFTEAWEQRKLGELMEVTSVRRVHQDEWTTQGVRFLRARDLVAYANNTEIELPLYISKELYEKYTAQSGKVEIGDLLVTGVGTIGVPWLVETPSPVYFKDGNIIWFKNKNAINGKYFYYAFTSASIQKFIKESAGTGTVGTYTIDTGKKTPIYIPSTFEQHKIASAMKRFDSLITLHQRKLDALKKIKSALLEKMFV